MTEHDLRQADEALQAFYQALKSGDGDRQLDAMEGISSAAGFGLDAVLGARQYGRSAFAEISRVWDWLASVAVTANQTGASPLAGRIAFFLFNWEANVSPEFDRLGVQQYEAAAIGKPSDLARVQIYGAGAMIGDGLPADAALVVGPPALTAGQVVTLSARRLIQLQTAGVPVPDSVLTRVIDIVGSTLDQFRA